MKKILMAVIEEGQKRITPDVLLPLDGKLTRDDALEVSKDFLEIAFEMLESEDNDEDTNADD